MMVGFSNILVTKLILQLFPTKNFTPSDSPSDSPLIKGENVLMSLFPNNEFPPFIKGEGQGGVLNLKVSL